MIISIPWLKRYVDVNESTEEVGEVLTMLGHEAENISKPPLLDGIVAARVIEVTPHPNADRLTLCKVDSGTEILSVVCGAPNVLAGQMVPLATVGAVLPGNFRIKKSKIRGEISMGMLCSEKELNLSDDHSGILVLPEGTDTGKPVIDILSNRFNSIELDITPNRPDALSHYGIARDYAVKTGRNLRPIENLTGTEPTDPQEEVRVTLEDSIGCPRYIAGIVKNVKVGPSPQWMAELLESAGQRSINNIVDISNFVLLEMGHPTHIFDYKYFTSNEVLVRKAENGESFTTLDDVEHTLSDHHLLITDGGKPVALAGVMGGLKSAVSEDTDTVLIESAYFDPVTIRKSSKSLGMLTEASRRFERGTDPDAALTAFWRIVHLLEDLAGGELVSRVVDAYPSPIVSKTVSLRYSQVTGLAGFEIEKKFIETTLKGLGIKLTAGNSGDGWQCQIPGFRPDLEREIDLIEEIVRVYGYDRIQTTNHYESTLIQDDIDPRINLQHCYRFLSDLGYFQCYNNSLQSENLARISGMEPVKMINPLNRQMGHLRTSLFPGLLENLNFNVNNGSSNLQLFEAGQVHTQDGQGLNNIRETSMIAGVLTGWEIPGNIHDENGRRFSFFSVKGHLESMIISLTGKQAGFFEQTHPCLNDAHSMMVGTIQLGSVGMIQRDILAETAPDLDQVIAFEMDADILLDLTRRQRLFRKISPYPGIERDLNLVIDEHIKVEQITNIIIQSGGPWLQKVVPVNLFRHESLGPGKKSVVCRLVFKHNSRTLEDKDVNPVIEEIISVAGRKVGAKLRA